MAEGTISVAVNVTPEELMKKIIQAANAGYSNRDDYPPFAITPWDDRPKWAAYIEKVGIDLLKSMDIHVTRPVEEKVS